MLHAETPLYIYGPHGLKDIIDSVLRLSHLTLPFDLNITELEGRETVSFDGYDIKTVPLSHSVFTLGYIFEEAERPGRFDVKKAAGFGIPEGPLYGSLQRGESITLNDGRRIRSSEVLGPPRPGRRIIIAGDNDKPELFEPFGAVDMMIHEATYTQKDFDSLIKKYQHTTAARVAIVAERMGVDRLILTHISPRYDTQERLSELLEEARKHYSGSLCLAEDLMSVEL
jgi:ribonuclease Z